MSHVVVLVANGFTRENSRLQPWRYVYELATNRADDSEVYIITEGDAEQENEVWSEKLTVIRTRNLSIKKQKGLLDIITSLTPDELWWSTTPRTLVFYPLLSKINCKLIAFITCPLYTWRELLKATSAGVPFAQIKVLWQQRLVPRILFRVMLNKRNIDKVFVQSRKNMRILADMGVEKEKLKLIPVGIDKQDIEPVDQTLKLELIERHPEMANKVVYLYFGALRTIRGFDTLIPTFKEVIQKDNNTHLMILARGADDGACEELKNSIKKSGLSDNITVVGGWLSRAEVCGYIELSDAAVLPFILVPSDIPIAVLEAMAKGKPVVVSKVDGLPEMASGRGVVIDPLDKDKFSEALYSLSVDGDRRMLLGGAAQQYMDEYPCWADIGKMVELELR